MADPKKIESMCDTIREEWGGLDILVSTAASGVLNVASVASVLWG